jgi:hypothetical protein
MKLRLEKFAGLLPGIAANLLPANAAQSAFNCRLNNGTLTPWADKSAGQVATLTGTGIDHFICHARNSSDPPTSNWYGFTSNATEVFGWAPSPLPLASDTWRRLYWAGGKFNVAHTQCPKMSDVTALGTSTVYDLGLPLPSVTPVASGGATTGDVTLRETLSYIMTYVSYYGEESAPTVPSNDLVVDPIVNATGATHVTVSGLGDATNIPAHAEGGAWGHRITHKRVYRVNTGTSGTTYQLVVSGTYSGGTIPATGLIPIDKTSIVDNCENADLGESIISTEWYPPQYYMTGLISLPNGALAGFYLNEVCFSEPYFPHAWPVAYRYKMYDPVVGLFPFGTSVLVITQGPPVVLTGGTPGSMSVERLEEGYACICPDGRAIVDMGNYCLYPTTEGLMRVGVGGMALATKGLLTRREWQALDPGNVVAAYYDGLYIALYTGAAKADGSVGFVFNPDDGSFTKLGAGFSGIKALWTDPATGRLYISSESGGNTPIHIFNVVEPPTTAYTWKSRQFHTGVPMSFGWAKVGFDRGTTGTATINIYADGTLRSTQKFYLQTGIPAVDNGAIWLDTDATPKLKPYQCVAGSWITRTIQDGIYRLPAGFKATMFEIEITGTASINYFEIGDTPAEFQ